jgi:hypothetical protein
MVHVALVTTLLNAVERLSATAARPQDTAETAMTTAALATVTRDLVRVRPLQQPTVLVDQIGVV